MLLLLGVTPSWAQKATVNDVFQFRNSKQTGTIIDKDKIVGYFVFYFKEKVDKKNSSYEIEIFDDNYTSLKTFEIVRPKNSYLAEVVFNGEVFMLHFYDRKTGYEFVTFDKNGEKLGNSLIDDKNLSKYELQRIQLNMDSDIDNVSLFAIDNKSFVRQTFAKNDKLGYELVAYDNEAKEIWKAGSDPESREVQTVEIVDVNSRFITATVYKRPNVLARKSDVYFLLLDAKTGKVISERELGTDKEGQKSILKSFLLSEDGNLVVIGEFYKPGDDLVKDKSLGLYMQEIDANGAILKTVEYKWKGTIDKFKQANISAEDAKENEKAFYIYFHDVIKDKNGKIYLIGEQFRKNVSAAGVALNVLNGGNGSGASNFGVQLGNMVVMEFDSKYKMTGYDLIPKKKTTAMLPEGAGVWSPVTMGHYLKMIDGFDYAFTSKDREKDNYNIVYIDANRKESKEAKKSDIMLGVISIKNGKREQERVPINVASSNWWINAAKPGYISIGEYYRKEKKIDFHVEQIKY